MASLFRDDPPGFLARTPFGWHDPAAIRSTLAAVGFADPQIETVTLETPSASAADAATGLCLGSPLRSEIEARDPDRLDATVAAVAEALSRRFGEGAITGQGQALVVTATR